MDNAMKWVGLTIVFCFFMNAYASEVTIGREGTFAVQNKNKTEEVRGVVKAVKEAVLSIDDSARVLEIPYAIGESFSRGDLLLHFDCGVIKAQAGAAEAAYNGARLEYENNVEMSGYNATGRFDLLMSKAKMQEARAVSAAAHARTHYCSMRSPFDGQVAEIHINEHEMALSGEPLIKIVSVQDVALKLIVPSHWLVWLKPGHEFIFSVDETGEKNRMHVDKVAAEVNAISHTVLIVCSFVDEPSDLLLPGMSGTALFNVPLAVLQ